MQALVLELGRDWGNEWKDLRKLRFPWCLLPDNLGLKAPPSFLARLARFFNPSSEPIFFFLSAFSRFQEDEEPCNTEEGDGERIQGHLVRSR
jgi:hypothetical protein